VGFYKLQRCVQITNYAVGAGSNVKAKVGKDPDLKASHSLQTALWKGYLHIRTSSLQRVLWAGR
jgi:hypothetical protein